MSSKSFWFLTCAVYTAPHKDVETSNRVWQFIQYHCVTPNRDWRLIQYSCITLNRDWRLIQYCCITLNRDWRFIQYCCITSWAITDLNCGYKTTQIWCLATAKQIIAWCGSSWTYWCGYVHAISQFTPLSRRLSPQQLTIVCLPIHGIHNTQLKSSFARLLVGLWGALRSVGLRQNCLYSIVSPSVKILDDLGIYGCHM